MRVEVDHGEGIGGLTLGGGYGWLSGKHGLVIDMLEEAQVVLANGDIVTTNEKENSDLFWAIRGIYSICLKEIALVNITWISGAGSNFGVVASFTFRAFEQKNKLWSGLVSRVHRTNEPNADRLYAACLSSD